MVELVSCLTTIVLTWLQGFVTFIIIAEVSFYVTISKVTACNCFQSLALTARLIEAFISWCEYQNLKPVTCLKVP